MTARAVKSLLFSTLYPSSVRPGHGVFVETRLRELLRSGRVETRVLAPVPWFFSTHSRFGDYALQARTPRVERHNGIDVFHPRYALPPKIGMLMAPFSLAAGAWPAARRIVAQGFDFDVIDAHYFYPDGVAAALLATWMRKPFVITARGSDLNLIGCQALPRRMMQWAAQRASACIGVSQALVNILREWGVPLAKLHVLRNGVDLKRFAPVPVERARQSLGVRGGPVLLMVGNLVELKGHAIVIDALARLLGEFPSMQLLIVGDGPERERLMQQVLTLGLGGHVRLNGAVPHDTLPVWYSAADALVMASSREGWPNVLLESMACGTPVVATRCGGVPEVVASSDAGRLVEQRDPAALAAAIAALLRQRPQRERVRRYAEDFSWQVTSDAQAALFADLVSTRSGYPSHA